METPLDDIILSEEDIDIPLDDIILSEEDIGTPLDDIWLSKEDTETLGIPDAAGIFEDNTWIVDDPKGTVDNILFVMDIGIVVDGGFPDLLRDGKPELATFILGAIELSCVIMCEVMDDWYTKLLTELVNIGFIVLDSIIFVLNCCILEILFCDDKANRVERELPELCAIEAAKLELWKLPELWISKDDTMVLEIEPWNTAEDGLIRKPELWLLLEPGWILGDCDILVLGDWLILLEPLSLDVWCRFILGENMMLLAPGRILAVWSRFVLEEGVMLLELWTLDVWSTFLLGDEFMLLEPGRIIDVWNRFILEEGFVLLGPGGIPVLAVWKRFVLGEGFILLEPEWILVWIIFVLGEELMLLKAGIIFVVWVRLVLGEWFMLLEPWTKIDVCCKFVL